MTDAGLAHLKGLTNLQELDLNSTDVSDAGLVHLEALTGLKQLGLVGTKVTITGVQRLRKALPKSVIFDSERRIAFGRRRSRRDRFRREE